MNRLNGKRAFITAAGQGIGRAITERFVSEGASVTATDINAEALENLALAHPDNLTMARLDVTNRSAVFAAIGDAGPLDILVNCAGWVHNGDVLTATDDEWQFGFDLNCRSIFWTMQAALPAMRERRNGSIINIASVASSLKGVPGRFIYSATKAAVIGMTKAAAADYVTEGIRVNAICPGTVDSPSWRARVVSQAAAANVSDDDMRAAFIGRQPMGRVGTTAEIAQLAVYLASDESSFTTGQAHVIDGGWNM